MSIIIVELTLRDNTLQHFHKHIRPGHDGIGLDQERTLRLAAKFQFLGCMIVALEK